ncbi:hypothetical protein [Azospirillum sp.]|uniref:hypothetical protein n=1 Tax=Azospirillum sp. TaxID=34012 RepID=UPI003D73CC25
MTPDAQPPAEAEGEASDELGKTEYHVNYRGPTYLNDVWYLCGAFDSLAEARACFAARLTADLTAGNQVGCEWRLVGVRDAVIVEVHDHVRLAAKGPPTVLEDRR